MTFGQHIKTIATDAKQMGLTINVDWFVATIDRELPKWRKKAPKSDLPSECEEIYNAYPRKVGKDAALKAIAIALKKKDHVFLFAKAQEFARAVAVWPVSYRYGTDGQDRCPHPSSWFNAGRYNDDPREWRRIGGREIPDATKPSLQTLVEPAGWREWLAENTPDFEAKSKKWADLDPSHRRYITDELTKQI